MRTQGERIALLHQRAQELETKRRKTATTAWGGVCAALTVCLVAAVACNNDASHAVFDVRFAGSSMLDHSAGGYVLAAVIAFILGAAVTTACIKWQKKNKKAPDDNKRTDNGGDK